VQELVVAEDIEDLGDRLSLSLESQQAQFASDFRSNADALADMVRELIAWLRVQLQRHDCISVLGM
jgi:hypothetical protein